MIHALAEAARALVSMARQVPAIERVVAHAPLDRTASGRVLQKAGFTLVGEMDDEHEGAALRVQRWELPIAPATGAHQLA